MAQRTNCNASLRISDWTSSYASYWELHVLYNLPPPNCWSCLPFRGHRPATVFPTVRILNNPSLLSIPSVTRNWRQTIILSWRWPDITISDWSPFLVHYWINSIYSYQVLSLVGVAVISDTIRELYSQLPTFRFVLYLQTNNPTNANCLSLPSPWLCLDAHIYIAQLILKSSRRPAILHSLQCSVFLDTRFTASFLSSWLPLCSLPHDTKLYNTFRVKLFGMIKRWYTLFLLSILRNFSNLSTVASISIVIALF